MDLDSAAQTFHTVIKAAAAAAPHSRAWSAACQPVLAARRARIRGSGQAPYSAIAPPAFSMVVRMNERHSSISSAKKIRSMNVSAPTRYFSASSRAAN